MKRPYCFWYITGIMAFVFFFSCKSYKDKEVEMPDTPIRGFINISVDESFKPIVDALIQVYESNNPGTKINAIYKPEASCINDLWDDSTRMIISTVLLTEKERAAIVDSFKIRVTQLPVARDAIAIIINPALRDSLFTIPEIKSILTGSYPGALFPVFDGLSATSTVRYIKDSLLPNQKITSNAFGARTSDSVITYVANTPNAVGFIGVSWIGNKDDDQQLSFLKKVKIAQIESNDKKGKYILPVQANIYTSRYPMTRNLIYILKEGHRGLGTGFAEFMSGEIGQLIFRRAYLMPGRKNFILRPVQL